MKSFGHTLHEQTIKAGLVKLNSGIHFDMGANLNKYHPRIDDWQGIYYCGQHLTTMDRGVIPEYSIWAMDKFGQKTHIMRLGWRTTLFKLARKNIRGLDWANFCRVFTIDYKAHRGHAFSQKVA